MEPIQVLNKILIPAVSAAANINGTIQDISEVRNAAMQFTFTGSPVGVAAVGLSNDGINFDFSVYTVAISAAGTNMINLPSAGYKFVQPIFTYTSGTGNLTAIINGKL